MSILSALTAKKFMLELLDLIGQAECFLCIFLLNLPRNTLEELILVYDARVHVLLLHTDLLNYYPENFKYFHSSPT